MRVLTAEEITKTYGEKTLFQGISFSVAEKERVGLIGVNGTGKSSLLKIIAGIEDQDSGNFSMPNDYRISYLAQEPVLHPELSILDEVFQSDATIIQIMKSYETILSKLGTDPENVQLQEQLFQVQRQMDTHHAWDASANAKSILTKLGLHDFTKKVGELSGGQRKRVALAQVLIESPDLLILDEPTNHLDFESIKWLEDYLAKYPYSVLVVTHDRYFLDEVTNRIFELDGGNLYSYKGNYQSFIEAKANREIVEKQMAEKQQNLYRRELEWMRRGAKARTTKQKARIQRFEHLENTMSTGPSNEQVDMSLQGSRLGKQVFELKDATKSYGNKVILKDFNYLIKPGDRIGIIGKNGSGKSTLLNIFAGHEGLDQGEMITGQTVSIAYYTQGHEELDENQRMIEYLREAGEFVTTAEGERISISAMLERFLFPTHSHGTLIRKLSGGEKRRLFLLKLLMAKPNVLLLDEPTNDLDTETLTVLEDYIQEFPGVVITVSHDRYFLDKVAEQLLIFEGEGHFDTYYGEYTEYVQKQLTESKKIVEKKVPVQKDQPEEKKKKKMTYMEKKEWEDIEDVISASEQKLEQVQGELASVGSDFEKAQKLMDEEKSLQQQVEELMERWEYLSELADE